MTLLSMASALAHRALQSNELVEVVKINAADRAVLPMIGFVYASPEMKGWILEFVDSDYAATSYRLINEDRATKLVAKRVVNIMRKKLISHNKLAE